MRKIIQISTVPADKRTRAVIVALCSDGSIWKKSVDEKIWVLEKPVPTDQEYKTPEIK